jgi:hypothetical protein
VKIIQIDIKTVHYKLAIESLDSDTFIEKKLYLSAIKFKDGLIYNINSPHFSYDSLFSVQPRTLLKIITPRWFVGSYGIGIEHLTKKRVSWSIDLSIIFLPENVVESYSFINAKGLGLSLNERVYFPSKSYKRSRHNFDGNYFIHSLNFIRQYNEYKGYSRGFYAYAKEFGNGIHYTGASLTFGFGKQIVLANKFTIDAFVAGGIGIKTYRFEYFYDEPSAGSKSFSNTAAYGFALFGYQYNRLTMAGRMGINIGYLF